MMPVVCQGINDTCGRLTLEVCWFLLGYRSHGFHHYIAHLRYFWNLLVSVAVVLDNFKGVLTVKGWRFSFGVGFSTSTAL
jgi:hypothetical protein